MKMLLLLFLFSCATYAPQTDQNKVDKVSEIVQPIEVTSNKVKIEFVELKWFDAIQKERMIKIAKNLEVVINSDQFKQELLNVEWNNKKQMVSTSDTNEQVYNKITSADWKLTYKLVKLRYGSSVIGYTLPNVEWIALNSRKYYYLTDADLAANMAHEYGGHKFGKYDHDMKWSKSRDYSAPYAIGSVVEKIYNQMFK